MAVSSGARKTLIVTAALICACGLLVGYAHWYVHDLETGDVAWSTPEDDRPDRAVVVRGRVYTFDDETLTIRDLRTGRRIARTFADGFHAYVGDGGQVAVVGSLRAAFFSRDGEELWHHDVGAIANPVAIGTDGGLDGIKCDAHKVCRLAHYDQAGRRTARTVLKGTGSALAVTIGSPTYDDDRGISRLPTVPIRVDGDGAHELRAGRAWGPAVATTGYHELAQAGDLLVGLSRRGGNCVFAAVRSGKRAWTTSTPCPDLGFPALTVFADRLYASTSTDSGFDVVTTDLHGQRAASTHIRAATPPKNGRRELRPTPGVLVLVTTGTVAGYDPFSGRRLWVQQMSRSSADPLDESHRLYPGVEVSGAVIDVNEDTRPPWPQLALGHDTPSVTHTFLDPATGDTAAELAVPWGAQVSGTDDGAAIVLGDHRVRLVSPDGAR